MSCYHIAANVSMASVPALLQASFYLCDQGQLIPPVYLLSSLYRGRNVLRTGLFADLDLRNVDVASDSVSLQASAYTKRQMATSLVHLSAMLKFHVSPPKPYLKFRQPLLFLMYEIYCR